MHETSEQRGEREMESMNRHANFFAPLSSEMPLPELGVSNRSLFQGKDASTMFEYDEVSSLSL